MSLFSRRLLNLTLSLTIQSSIKYVLTQGDSLLIASLASLQDQGAYALSSNYGGLIARMLFQPIEEASRNLFAKLCAPASSPSTEKPKNPSSNPQTPAADGVKKASTTLRDILKFYSLISLVAFSLGPTLAPLLLSLVAGSKWSATGAGDVLGTYCYYIPLLAINGVSEAFVAATADQKELYAQSFWMGGFFAAFAGSAYLFLCVLGLGAEGLVWANCVNMGCRIVFNLGFVKRFFRKNGQVSLRFVNVDLYSVVDASQAFDVVDTLPTMYSVSATAVVISVLRATKGVLAQYGLVGEFVRIGGIGGVFVLTL